MIASRPPTWEAATNRELPRGRAVGVIAGVCVLLAAVAATALVAARSGATGAAAAGSPRTFTGRTWRLVAVTRTGRERVDVGRGVNAWVAFEQSREVHGSDGVNFMSSTWRGGSRAVAVSEDSFTTLVLYVGHDPARRASVDAFDALFMRGVHFTVRVHRTPHRLELRSGTYRLVFVDDGPGPRFATPSPSRPRGAG